MMIQHVVLRPRLQLLALAAFGLAAAGVAAAPRVSLAPAAPEREIAASVSQAVPVVRAVVRDAGVYVSGDLVGDASPAIVRQAAAREAELQARGCATGAAYVTGDMAGDSSPAQVYAALCGR